MAEHLEIASGSKDEKYALLFKQIESVIAGETDMISRMANVASMIHFTFHFWWTGFYRVVDGELHLGPFQGPLACTRIKHGRGVCGTAWASASTQVVPDVDLFPGHIACSSSSRSEIVVPLMLNGEVVAVLDIIFNYGGEQPNVAVLDIDSEQLATFDNTDRLWLERIANLLTE